MRRPNGHRQPESVHDGDFADLLPPLSHFIAGKFVAGTGEAVPDIYPASGEMIAEIRWATESKSTPPWTAAQAGFEIWRRTPPRERARVLARTAAILRAEQRRTRPPRNPRYRQGDPGNACDRRGLGRRLPRILCRAGGDHDRRAYRLFRRRRRLGLYRARATRGVRRHRRVELSAADRRMEIGAGARLRQCFHPQARGADAAVGIAPARKPIARPACPTESSTSSRATAPLARNLSPIPASPRYRSPARRALAQKSLPAPPTPSSASPSNSAASRR